MTDNREYQRYSPEFKREAVRQLVGKSVRYIFGENKGSGTYTATGPPAFRFRQINVIGRESGKRVKWKTGQVHLPEIRFAIGKYSQLDKLLPRSTISLNELG